MKYIQLNQFFIHCTRNKNETKRFPKIKVKVERIVMNLKYERQFHGNILL